MSITQRQGTIILIPKRGKDGDALDSPISVKYRL